MSITLGIYDLFSYLIPGLLYLYIGNEVLRIFGQKYIDISVLAQGGQSSINLITGTLILVLAYVLGNIIEIVRGYLFDNWLYSNVPDQALTKIRRRMSRAGMTVEFNHSEWSIYQEVLRVRNGEIGETDRHKAEALMMRNLSFGSLLYAALQLMEFILQTNSYYHILLGLLAIGVSILTWRRARRFDEWNYRSIYSQALAYGSNLKDFLENSTPAWSVKEQAKRTDIRKKSQ